MRKYKTKNHWNFRIVTKIIPAQIGNDLKGNSTLIHDDYRVFSICEVYYHNDKPDSYIESKRILDELQSIKDLKWTHKKIKKAFKKPILDLDNWPKKWRKQIE